MATFRTPAESQKWDNLSNAISIPISKMSKGTATPEDLSAIGDALKKYDKLAADLFDSALIGAENVADIIVTNKNKERVAQGKRPMSQPQAEKFYEHTFKEVLAAQAEDIMGMLKDFFSDKIEKAVGTISEDTKAQLSTLFDKIRGVTGDNDSDKSETKSDSPAEGTVQLADVIKAKDKGSSAAKADTKQASLFDRFRSNDEPEAPEASNAKTQDSTGKPKDTPLSKQVKKQLAENEKARKKILSGIEEEEDEPASKKANAWIGKVKDFFTNKTDWIKNKYSKIKGKANKYADMASSIIKPLMLALMAPELFSSIARQIGEVMGFDKISDFVASTWKSVKDSASDAVDWVVKKVKSWFDSSEETKAKEQAIKDKDAQVAKQKGIPVAAVTEARRTEQAKLAYSGSKGDIAAGIAAMPKPQPAPPAGSTTPAKAGSIASVVPAASIPSIPAREQTTQSDYTQQLNMFEGMYAKATNTASEAIANGKPVPASVQKDLDTLPKRIASIKARIGSNTSTASTASVPTSGSNTTVSAPSGTSAPSTGGIVTNPTAPKATTAVESSNSVRDTGGIVVESPADVLAANTKPASSRQGVASNTVNLGTFNLRAGDDALFMYNLGICES